MQASIIASTKQSRDQYLESAGRLKNTFPKEASWLEPPEVREGETEAGNPYVFFRGMTAAAEGNGKIYFARSLVWCKDRGTTVDMVFEAVPRMASQVGQNTEKQTFDKASSTICLSVK
jgi:hypothetical protein